MDVSYQLKSQAGACDLKRPELNAEIETGSGGNSATYCHGSGDGIP
jgi:hypothetical protein